MSSLPILVLNSGSSSIKFAMYEAADGQRTKIFEGAVDGIATDNGKFWLKDAEGKKLIDETPDLPNRSVAFSLVAKTLNSGKFPRPVPSATAPSPAAPLFLKTSSSPRN